MSYLKLGLCLQTGELKTVGYFLLQIWRIPGASQIAPERNIKEMQSRVAEQIREGGTQLPKLWWAAVLRAVSRFALQIPVTFSWCCILLVPFMYLKRKLFPQIISVGESGTEQKNVPSSLLCLELRSVTCYGEEWRVPQEVNIWIAGILCDRFFFGTFCEKTACTCYDVVVSLPILNLPWGPRFGWISSRQLDFQYSRGLINLLLAAGWCLSFYFFFPASAISSSSVITASATGWDWC